MKKYLLAVISLSILTVSNHAFAQLEGKEATMQRQADAILKSRQNQNSVSIRADLSDDGYYLTVTVSESDSKNSKPCLISTSKIQYKPKDASDEALSKNPSLNFPCAGYFLVVYKDSNFWGPYYSSNIRETSKTEFLDSATAYVPVKKEKNPYDMNHKD